MTIEKLDARIAELKTQIEQLTLQANVTLGELRGRLSEVEAMRAMLVSEKAE